MKLLKHRITKWKKEEVEDLENKKRACLLKIAELEKKEMESGLETDEKGAKAMVEQDYQRMLRMEEIS